MIYLHLSPKLNTSISKKTIHFVQATSPSTTRGANSVQAANIWKPSQVLMRYLSRCKETAITRKKKRLLTQALLIINSSAPIMLITSDRSPHSDVFFLLAPSWLELFFSFAALSQRTGLDNENKSLCRGTEKKNSGSRKLELAAGYKNS